MSVWPEGPRGIDVDDDERGETVSLSRGRGARPLTRHSLGTDSPRVPGFNSGMQLSPADAALLAAELDLDYATAPVCRACLTFVSFPLDLGDERKAWREAATLAPDLWEEGLEEPARSALERAREAGIERAAEAIREVEGVGAWSEVVRAIVLRLARAQVEEMRARRPRPG